MPRCWQPLPPTAPGILRAWDGQSPGHPASTPGSDPFSLSFSFCSTRLVPESQQASKPPPAASTTWLLRSTSVAPLQPRALPGRPLLQGRQPAHGHAICTPWLAGTHPLGFCLAHQCEGSKPPCRACEPELALRFTSRKLGAPWGREKKGDWGGRNHASGICTGGSALAFPMPHPLLHDLPSSSRILDLCPAHPETFVGRGGEVTSLPSLGFPHLELRGWVKVISLSIKNSPALAHSSVG